MLYSGFFNSVNHDRKYSAQDFSRIFDGVINDGVFMTVGDKFAVTPGSGLAVVIGSGRAWFNSVWAYNDGPVSIALSAAPLVGSRKDAIILRIKTANEFRYSEFAVLTGTATEGTPVAPTPTDSGNIHEHVLAYVTVDHGATSIAAAKIDNTVIGTTTTPIVTSILQQTDLDIVYAAWQDEFETWEDAVKDDFQDWITEMQDILDENAAANLTAKYVEISGSFATRDLELSFTLTAADWTGSSAPYSQTVTVNGITEGMKAVFDIAESATDAQALAASDALLRVSGHAINSITIKAYGVKPDVDVPCTLLISDLGVYNGSSMYGTCSTAAGTAAKTVSVPGLAALVTGAAVLVKFTNGNTNANPTLNVNGSGAKTITDAASWPSGSTVAFVYDGTYWDALDVISGNTYDIIDGGTW